MDRQVNIDMDRQVKIDIDRQVKIDMDRQVKIDIDRKFGRNLNLAKDLNIQSIWSGKLLELQLDPRKL